MHMKIHRTPAGEVVALCDTELLGSVLSDGKRRLDLKSHAGFYSGSPVSEQEAVKALSGAQNINLVGKKSLEAARKAGIDISSAVMVSGVPHLQAYKI
ncbi:MAG: DUF424 family protein [Candidatus Micrarchaeota archaeon]|nr:DUF424 family protein [Candidatus Micrarchaeota archaeon]